MNDLGNFTNLYSLSKTLRFELKPEVETKARFENWLKTMNEENPKKDNLFAKDKAIFEAYKVIKPVMDKIHEDFITLSLQSEDAKKIDFQPYYEAYKTSKELSKKSKKIKTSQSDDESKDNQTTRKVVEKQEENLRKLIGETYQNGNVLFGKTSGAKDIKALTDKSILDYIEKNISNFTTETLTKDELQKHLNAFKGFFTFLKGYNTNRENFYSLDKEKSTAVASRIVHENLPKFCDNAIRFEKRHEEYLNVYQYLKESGKTTQIKNAKTGEFQEIEPITEKTFTISRFNLCLSQPQIEEYNKMIGNFNELINLYNQERRQEKDFKKLDEFVTLYKQIGCGKSKALFIALQKDKESELTEKERQSGEILTVEKLLNIVATAGNSLFKESGEESVITLPKFVNWLKNCDNWDGVYWSKGAVSIISSLYFANWHDLKDKLKGNKACVSFDKKREEQIQLNDAVELSGLFAVLDDEQSEFVFKQSIFDDENNKNIINKKQTPSKNLINLICADVEKNIKYFLEHTDEVTHLEKYKEDNQEEGKDDTIISQIKAWFDAANDTIRIVRYFSVRASKMKGNVSNSEMDTMLSYLLDTEKSDWSKWYDAVRNYLTQSPQDSVKDNMLKLNFGSSSLLKGWSDGQEKVKLSTLLMNDNDVFLCILKQSNIFDTSKTNNPIISGKWERKKTDFAQNRN